MSNPEMYEWARGQMSSLGVPDDHAQAVERLLEVYWESGLSEKFDENTAKDFLKVFTELAQNHTLVPDSPNETWEEAKPGRLVVRDRVRVKADAYTGPAGTLHNGRVGTVVSIRYGDILVRYDNHPQGDYGSVRHSPFVLEKRIQ